MCHAAAVRDRSYGGITAGKAHIAVSRNIQRLKQYTVIPGGAGAEGSRRNCGNLALVIASAGNCIEAKRIQWNPLRHHREGNCINSSTGNRRTAAVSYVELKLIGAKLQIGGSGRPVDCSDLTGGIFAQVNFDTGICGGIILLGAADLNPAKVISAADNIGAEFAVFSPHHR